MPNTNNTGTDQGGNHNRTIADDIRLGAQNPQPGGAGGPVPTGTVTAPYTPKPTTTPAAPAPTAPKSYTTPSSPAATSPSVPAGQAPTASTSPPAASAGGQQSSTPSGKKSFLRDFFGADTSSDGGDSTLPSIDLNAWLAQLGVDPSSGLPAGTTPTGTTPTGGTPTGGGPSSGGGSNGTGYSNEELLRQALSQAGIWAPGDPYQLPEIMRSNPDKLKHISTDELKSILQQIVDAQTAQANGQIDYGVQRGIDELTRAMEDAAGQYQTQRNQIAADELRALDNQALYAEARGDRGGIGQAQYGAIQATAAQNRRAVNDAQVKLSTDTARQISDLRSQGEFQKADQLLSITQSYLSQLMNLEQWALETNLGVDQFNIELEKWMDEYNLNVQQFLTDLDLSAAQLTGVFANGQQTLAAKNQLRDSLASSGSALLNAGVLPSRQQLEAMGMTEAQAKAYLNKTAE